MSGLSEIRIVYSPAQPEGRFRDKFSSLLSSTRKALPSSYKPDAATLPECFQAYPAPYSCCLVYCLCRERVFRANARPAPPRVE